MSEIDKRPSWHYANNGNEAVPDWWEPSGTEALHMLATTSAHTPSQFATPVHVTVTPASEQSLTMKIEAITTPPVARPQERCLKLGRLRVFLHRWEAPINLNLGNEWAWGYGPVTVMWRGNRERWG